MAFAVVDYTEAHFGAEGLPAGVGGRFVVLSNGEHRFAVFAPRDMAVYHANIVERFLAGLGVGGWYNPKGDVFTVDSDAWAIEGGGHWEWDRAAGLLGVFGESRSYGSVDLDQLAAGLREAGAFGEAQVMVRN